MYIDGNMSIPELRRVTFQRLLAETHMPRVQKRSASLGRRSLNKHRSHILGRIRGTLKREPLLNPLLALLKRDLIQRVYIPQGPPNPIPYHKGIHYRQAEHTVTTKAEGLRKCKAPTVQLFEDPAST